MQDAGCSGASDATKVSALLGLFKVRGPLTHPLRPLLLGWGPLQALALPAGWSTVGSRKVPLPCFALWLLFFNFSTFGSYELCCSCCSCGFSVVAAPDDGGGGGAGRPRREAASPPHGRLWLGASPLSYPTCPPPLPGPSLPLPPHLSHLPLLPFSFSTCGAALGLSCQGCHPTLSFPKP